uniref:AlbXVI protein n=1 Tax=Xanthomonas albilineans TaxID=29447 RepID=Q70C43_XANAL|nr:AlbXVI protein [Xanthomonas albilineans]
MRTSKFNETQIIATLKQADAGVPVKDICRQVGISTATYYQWKSKYVASEMPSSRHTSLTWRPPSTCFSVATIWLSVNLLLRIVGRLGG